MPGSKRSKKPQDRRKTKPKAKRATKRAAKPKAKPQTPGKLLARDVEAARALRARRDRLDSEVVQRKGESRGAYLARRSRAKSDAPRPAPPSRTYKENGAYKRHRGYFYKDAAGKWRTPSGQVAKGQRLVTNDSGRRAYEFSKARQYNSRHRAKLTREDAYISLLSHGATLSRSKYSRIVGKAEDRDAITRRIREADKRGDLDTRREARKRDDSARGHDVGGGARGGSRGDEGDDEGGEGGGGGDDLRGDDFRDHRGDDRDDGFDYDDWADDFDTDGGDTP